MRSVTPVGLAAKNVHGADMKGGWVGGRPSLSTSEERKRRDEAKITLTERMT